jgi:membrane associated rhomboid family serine protease
MAFVPEPQRQPFMRVPAATAGLILALVAAHIAITTLPAERSYEILRNYAFIPARYSHDYLAAHGIDPGSLWDRTVPFFSYTFIHANATHLLLNCAWLLPFGAITARRFGALLFLALFLACGAAGAAAHLATHWASTQPAVGASAAIAGLMAAGFRMIAAADNVVGADFAAPPRIAPLSSGPVLSWSVMTVAIFVVAGVTGLGAGPGAQIIAWQAHIGGYLAGLVLAGPCDWLSRGRRQPARFESGAPGL